MTGIWGMKASKVISALENRRRRREKGGGGGETRLLQGEGS